MLERNPSKIPKHLRALYEARTAHDGVRAALSLIKSTQVDLQPELLSDQLFLNIMDSILQGLDECRRNDTLEIISSFDKKLQPIAFQLFLDPAN